VGWDKRRENKGNNKGIELGFGLITNVQVSVGNFPLSQGQVIQKTGEELMNINSPNGQNGAKRFQPVGNAHRQTEKRGVLSELLAAIVVQKRGWGKGCLLKKRGTLKNWWHREPSNIGDYGGVLP